MLRTSQGTSQGMSRGAMLFAFALSLMTASLSFADGFAIARAANGAPMPSQCAVLAWKDGVETLAIRTDIEFKAGAGEAAWVLPVPAEPELFEVTSGAIESARAQFAPQIRSVSGLASIESAVALAVCVLVAHLACFARASVGAKGVLLICTLFCGFVALLAPAVGRSRGLSGMGESSVQVRASRVIGSYDVTVISSNDVDALRNWLTDFGVALPKEAEPVLASYLAEKWCFVAAKLRDSGAGVHSPHPIGMRFPTEAPVYPMRLTAVGNGGSNGAPLDLELYVFAEGTAEVPGMTIRSSGKTQEVANSYQQAAMLPAEEISISHPGVLAMVEGRPWATRLKGSFSPDAMARDLHPTIGAARVIGRTASAERDRTTITISTGILASGIIGIIALPFSWRRRWTLGRAAAFLAVNIAVGVIAARLSVRGVEFVQTTPFLATRAAEFRVTRAWQALTELDRGVADLDEAKRVFEAAYAKQIEATDSSPLVFGDGPGQYMIRDVNGEAELSTVNWFGQYSAEIVTIPIRSPDTTNP